MADTNGMTPQELEKHYQTFMSDLPRFLPDGILEVDLDLLNDLGLLNVEEDIQEDTLSHSFYVLESTEKLTLFNQKFIVWIVPKVVGQLPTTYTLVALNETQKPSQLHLEMAFATSGVYNQSNLVLRILEKFLEQIEENEKEICKFKL